MALADFEVEERNIDQIAASTAELRRLQPHVEEAVIEGLVQEVYEELMPVKVHSFMTLLIVHQVRDILRGRRVAA